jgi:2-amino-4-ketopentanoate thiolase beta subunit
VGDRSYQGVMARRGEILRRSIGIDYGAFELEGLAFDYEALLRSAGFAPADAARIQREVKVGGTPLLELPRLTRLARELAPAGKGATILLKDEAANASGSFKARRAALAVH